MMWEFVRRHVLYMLPAVAIMAFFIQGAVVYPSDWAVHIGWSQAGDYPPLAPLLTTNAFRAGLIVPWAVALFIAVPYLLIRYITKSDKIALAYLYLSGLPWTLCWGGFFSQSLVHILLLLDFISPIFWPITIFFGGQIHREIIGASAVAIAVSTYYRVFHDGQRKR